MACIDEHQLRHNETEVAVRFWYDNSMFELDINEYKPQLICWPGVWALKKQK